MRSRLLSIALLLTALFAFLGFADAAYLTADHYLALPVPCGLTGGCETVLASEYSTVGPVPLALLGALYYLAALFLTVYIYTGGRRRLTAARLILALSGAGVLASAFLVYVQASVLQAFCQYCLVSAGTTLALFISSWVLVRQMARSMPPGAAQTNGNGANKTPA